MTSMHMTKIGSDFGYRTSSIVVRFRFIETFLLSVFRRIYGQYSMVRHFFRKFLVINSSNFKSCLIKIIGNASSRLGLV